MQEVNFSELNEAKKQEFFDYLMSNNIQFKEGESNYYAKVVLKPNTTTGRPKPSVSKGKEKENVKPKAVKQLCQVKRTSYQQQQPTTIRNHSSIAIKKQTQLSLSDYSFDTALNLSDIVARTEKSNKSRTHRQQYTSKSKQINVTNSRILKPRQRPQERDLSQRPEPKVKDRPSLNRSQLTRTQQKLSPYLRVFGIIHILSRPTKWPRYQLDRSIQEIYTVSFNKNNTILKSKKLKQAMEKNYVFVSFISEFYEHKFKNKKTSQYNMIGLVNSLLCHLEQQRSRNLVMFSKFLMEDYQYEDLIFFLFLRSLAQKLIKQGLGPGDKRVKAQQGDYNYLATKKQVISLVRTLVGRDTKLADEYVSHISSHMVDGTIPLYQVLQILVQNYNQKRNTNNYNQGSCNEFLVRDQPPQHSRQSLSPKPQTNFLQYPPRLPPRQVQTVDYQAEESTEELTFGEETGRNIESTNGAFWYETNQKADPPQDKLQVQVIQRMDNKISELIKYILDDEEQFKLTISQFHGLIFNKAKNLIRAVFDMDKIRWFKLLNIRQPEASKLSHVQSLQKMVRVLRSDHQNNSINRFCKDILTTSEFLEAIKKIVIS